MMKREASLRFLKRIVQQSPADQTEALLLTEDSSLTRFTPSSIHQHVAEKNGTLILRVVEGKRIAVVITNRLTRSAVRTSLEKALALLQVQQSNDAFLSLPGPEPIRGAQTFVKSITTLTPARKARTVKEMLTLLKEKGCQGSGAFSSGVVEVAVVNSLGTEAYQIYSDLFFHLIAEGPGTGFASFVGRDPGSFDVEALCREAMEKALHGHPVQADPGEYEVILEPDATAEMLSFLGFLGFHAQALQEERSFFCHQLGKKLADEKVTIYDDGLDPAGLQVPFDFEGVPKQRVTFLDQGVAREVTYDSFTAGKEGKRSTGHGLIAPSTEGPIPINLVMKAGKTSLREMVRSVRRGIYVTRFHYTNVVEPMKAVITGMTRDGTFLIEQGEVTRPIKNLRFTESILNALSRVKAVSKERKVCSEGTVYSRRFVTGTVAPALQIDGFHFSGVSAL